MGLDVSPTYYKKVFEKYRDKKSRFFWVYYCVLEGKQEVRLDKEEVMDARWVKYGDIDYLDNVFGFFETRNDFLRVFGNGGNKRERLDLFKGNGVGSSFS